jgi:sulfate adenylyltransferase
MVQSTGGFVLVYVATPIDLCEQRDPKSMYAKARAGIIKNFTGVSDPYEAPDDADLVIDTTSLETRKAADQILCYLESRHLWTRTGFVPCSPWPDTLSRA